MFRLEPGERSFAYPFHWAVFGYTGVYSAPPLMLLRAVVAAGTCKSATEDRDYLVKFIDNDNGIFIVESAGKLLSRGEVGAGE